MKRLLFLTALCLACILSQAQSKASTNGIITGARKVYLNFHDQKDSLFMPVVSDKYPELREALSDKNIFQGDKLEEVVANYSSCGCGVTGLSYEVLYQSQDIISIELYFDIMDNHPATRQQLLTLNVHTGKPYLLSNEIDVPGLEHVAALYKRKLKQSIDADKELKPDDEVEKMVYDELARNADTLRTNTIVGSYVFTTKGVLVTTEDLLPDSAHDHEPDRYLLLTYGQLKPYIKAGAAVLKK